MPIIQNPDLRRVLAERIRYYNELGIYDFYQRGREVSDLSVVAVEESQPELREEMSPRKTATVASIPDESIFEVLTPNPEHGATDPVAALKLIREDLGDCTRCKLHKQGRKQIVFGVGNPRAELMFVGEGPGADEDAQGEPFVGRAGQLLNNMIKAMGIRREDVYIANVVKCRPPGNRTPERDECDTCSPFLMRQIAVIKPKVVVALGAVSAKNLLAINAPMSELRGRFYDFMPAGARSSDPSWQGSKLAVTYHPAFLLRDPRQKGEAWKDLQMVMKYLGLKPPKPTV
ncbi:MAG TPA: uracil-DNA glycosylase [Candidatus Dormibacteraeota bacterium]|nr:uracil-DNA glycosylase [Candidatus Dormibacteraeota bacterium]